MTKGHWPIGGQFKRGAELEPLAPALLAMHSGTLRLAKTKVQVPQTAGGAVAASRQAAMKLDLPTTAVPGVK